MSETFEPRLFQIARRWRGLSQASLAKNAGISQALLSKFENGIAEPDSNQLGPMARALDLPAPFFCQSDRVYGMPLSVHAMFRRKASVGQKRLDGLIGELNVRLMHLRRLLNAVELKPKLSFPQFDIDAYGGAAEAIAADVRRTWLLPDGPIDNLVDAAERAGCIIMLMDFHGADIDGVTYQLPDLPPCVFLNQDRPTDRLRFSLAHELGHLVMHKVPSETMEDEANAFASALLMPAAEIRRDLSGLTLRSAARVKRVWRVSMAASIVRAGRIGAITENQQRYLHIQMRKRGLHIREPAELDLPVELPTVFPHLFAVHCQQLGYSAAELASALHLSEPELYNLYGNYLPARPEPRAKLERVK